MQVPHTAAEPVDGFTALAQRQLTRDSAFAYQCRRCTRCCSQYRIPVGPFDLLLLAQALELTTTEVIRRHLVDGFFLQRRADGACQFLDPTGCSVHAGRPLVCRIYPLGRSVSAGQEWFHAMAPVADSAGEWGETSTVQDYLEQQDALPSIEGVTLYLDLHAQLARGLATLPAASPDADVMTTAPGLSADTALDPDAAIAQYCARHQLTAPQEPMAKARCHALALTEWMDRQLEKLT